MRAATVLASAWGVVSLAVACSSGTAPSPVQGDGGVVAEGGVQPPPAHWGCSGEAGACLSGTAATKGFSKQPRYLFAELYRLFPLGTAMPEAQETVATDGTWAFDDVPAWGHYFVRIVADFGQSPAIATFAGPMAAPTTGGPVAVTVQPVQAVASEHGMGGSFVVDWASAHVFSPSDGSELQSGAATVSIDVGGTTTPMPWTTTGGQSLYFVDFGTPPAAQSSYTITASGQAFGSTPASWKLAASPPSFMPTITSPANGGMVSASQMLNVTWPAQAAADYVTVGLFQVTDGGVTAVGSDPPQLTPDTSSQTLALPGPGSYVVDVYFTTVACPTTSDGCVLSSAVAASQFTAQ
ncbi:MAG TPA: hypothetical protein VF765_04185 [Polyangiaceae bacterium]